MESDHEVKNLFADHEFVGNILRWTTLLESNLDCTLTQYFSRSDRLKITLELLMPEISLSRKIELLARLPIRKSLKNHKKAVTGLRRFNRLRNIVAHNWIITLQEARNLLNGEDYRRMLLSYPKGTQNEFANTRNALNGLARSKEFIVKNRKSPFPLSYDLFEKLFD